MAAPRLLPYTPHPCPSNEPLQFQRLATPMQKPAKFCTHVSRSRVEGLIPPIRAALISIQDPDTGPAKINRSVWVDVLRLQFNDLAEARPEQRDAGYVLPQKHHARQCATFIRRHWGECFFVCCETGLGASASVCAVQVSLGWNYIESHPHRLSHANQLLIRLLESEFGKAAAKKDS